MLKMISSDETELEARIDNLRNRFHIMALIAIEGEEWINIAMSSDNNKCFPRSMYIKLYSGDNN